MKGENNLDSIKCNFIGLPLECNLIQKVMLSDVAVDFLYTRNMTDDTKDEKFVMYSFIRMPHLYLIQMDRKMKWDDENKYNIT